MNREHRGIEMSPFDAKDGIPSGRQEDPGVSIIEATMATWGRKGKRLVVVGLAVFMLLFELDNSTVFIYHNYSASDLKALASLGTLMTATAIIVAVTKPFAAKLSNVIGRGQTLIISMFIYIPSYILMSTAQSVRSYAAGLICYAIAQSSTSVMTAVIISDITTARWRGLALGISYSPFLVLPWVAGPFVDSVVDDNGIGWRWDMGIYAILMPFASSVLIATLLIYQRRAEKQGVIQKSNLTVHKFCSEIDLGGLILFMAGFTCLLVPISLAATQPSSWRTLWIIALIVIGIVLLTMLPFYEKFVATHPVALPSYFKNRTILFSLLILAADTIGFQCTHTYMYAWAIISHDYSTTLATYYVYMYGVTQCLAGICAGAIMKWTAQYKWLVVSGAAIRLVGYGLMLRLRGQDNSIAELFGQQVIQGIGSGIVHTALFVPAQVVVPHVEIAQVVALLHSFTILGGSIGTCIAGAVYTGTFRERLWDRLGELATPDLVKSLVQSITGIVPEWDSPTRVAINNAYSDVMRSMTYVALATSVPVLILCLFLPNLPLPDTRTMVALDGRKSQQ